MEDDPIQDPPTDEQLATQAQAGCAASFEQLVRRLQVPLVHFLIRRTRCSADAEDLAQDTFVRAHRSLQRYSSNWRFRTWLFTIAHRLSINLAQRSRREQQAPLSLETVASRAANPSELLAAADERETLWNTVANLLDKDHVSALWLHYVEELSTAEIAEVVGRSRMAVKTMLFRARKRLLPHVRSFSAVESNDEMSVKALPDSTGTAFKVANA